ncbi:MAG: quinone-dependent dihydroorotate dehydrogenase [Bacteroidales bacterium]|jgi:dihydroorotate dehydrogenase|nr:quinone-dependent dihydroorotate dehydrogenase [Bacteroidales bacterium]
MYKSIVRPLLFTVNPEKIHHVIVSVLKLGYKVPGLSNFLKWNYTVKSPLLEREFLGMKFNNPVGFAAGFDKDAEVYNPLSMFGFSYVEIGTVTPKSQPGNPKPRMFRLKADSGLINRMGFNNKGVENAVKNLKKPHKLIIGGNIGKNTSTPNENAVEDYHTTFSELYDHVDYFVVNVSCPNISNLAKLQDKDSLIEILKSLNERRQTKDKKKPILLKISPDLNTKQIDDVIELYYENLIDGIVATNTSITRDNLNESQDSVKKIGNGGLSGAPLTRKSTEVIRYISTKSDSKIPIIGVGGINSVDDAIDKIEAGATLLQVYTGFIYNGPGFVKKINKAILKKEKNSRD